MREAVAKHIFFNKIAWPSILSSGEGRFFQLRETFAFTLRPRKKKAFS
jgi:hypothetical protein